MKVGISTATLFGGNRHLVDNLVTIKKLGFEVVEVFLNTFSEYNENFAKTLLSRLDGIEVNSIHTLNNFEGQLFNNYEKAFNEALAIFEGALKAGKVLNAKYYTFHGFFKKLHCDNICNFDKVGPRYKKLTEFAQNYGITITQENVSWACYEKPPYFSNIVKYAPLLKACLDIKQATRAGISIDEYVKDMSGRIATVHLSDYDSSGRLCPPGKGVIDFERLFNLLKEHGFDGNMLIELYEGDFGTLDELAISRDYLEQIISKIN